MYISKQKNQFYYSQPLSFALLSNKVSQNVVYSLMSTCPLANLSVKPKPLSPYSSDIDWSKSPAVYTLVTTCPCSDLSPDCQCYSPHLITPPHVFFSAFPEQPNLLDLILQHRFLFPLQAPSQLSNLNHRCSASGIDFAQSYQCQRLRWIPYKYPWASLLNATVALSNYIRSFSSDIKLKFSWNKLLIVIIRPLSHAHISLSR